MIDSVEAFLGWFAGIHRRTLRDVALLPEEAGSWMPPPRPEEEASWGIPKIVAHIAEARGYFAGAFAGDGWVWNPWPEETPARDAWALALERSALSLTDSLSEAGDERLRTKIELIGDSGRSVSGWRVLMMMAEHEVHHRAQISTYAGLNGWPVAQTFDRTNEWVVAQRDLQLRLREKRGS